MQNFFTADWFEFKITRCRSSYGWTPSKYHFVFCINLFASCRLFIGRAELRLSGRAGWDCLAGRLRIEIAWQAGCDCLTIKKISWQAGRWGSRWCWGPQRRSCSLPASVGSCPNLAAPGILQCLRWNNQTGVPLVWKTISDNCFTWAEQRWRTGSDDGPSWVSWRRMDSWTGRFAGEHGSFGSYLFLRVRISFKYP